MDIVNYFFKRHISRCKKELEDFENEFSKIKDEFKSEARKYIDDAYVFFNSTHYDYYIFNDYIRELNNNLNRIMKNSTKISSLVYVIENVSEEDFYTEKNFITIFKYDYKLIDNLDKHYSKLLTTLNKLIKLSPKDFEAYKDRADLEFELKFYTDAMEDYNKVLELNSNYSEVKEYLETIKKILESKDISNSSKNTAREFYRKGMSFFDEKMYENALENLNRCIDLGLINDIIYGNRGSIKFKLKLYYEAEKDFDIAMNLDRNSDFIKKWCYRNKGEIKFRLGLYKEALEYYNEAIKLDKDNMDLLKRIEITKRKMRKLKNNS